MPGQPDPQRIAAKGYDRIAERYARWVSHGAVDEARPGPAASEPGTA